MARQRFTPPKRQPPSGLSALSWPAPRTVDPTPTYGEDLSPLIRKKRVRYEGDRIEVLQ